MQKPKSVTYGIRLLYVQLILVAFALDLWAKGMPFIDAFFLFLIPLALAVYFIRLISKGTFWARSVLLAVTILDILHQLFSIRHLVDIEAIIVFLLILFLVIRVLFYLYSKESNTWYAHLLMEENLKKNQIK